MPSSRRAASAWRRRPPAPAEKVQLLAIPRQVILKRSESDPTFAARCYRGPEPDEEVPDVVQIAGDRFLRQVQQLEGKAS